MRSSETLNAGAPPRLPVSPALFSGFVDYASELPQLLGVSRRTLDKYRADPLGAFPPILKLGRRSLVSVDALRRWMENRTDSHAA